ncbi:MAG: lactonase family protein [Actinomycetota bacterium]|nr:lactonase family protein [Actinomycetota bacterium]
MLSLAVGLLTAGILTLVLQVFFHVMRAASSPPNPISPTTSVSPSGETCRTAQLPNAARLGNVAWVSDGALMQVELGSCRQTVLMGSDAAPPVRFSHDGQWVALGDGQVLPAAGGSAVQPLGSVRSWEWSPTDDVLAAVTATGGVTIGGPGLAINELLPEGSGVGHLAFSPNGRYLAVDVRRVGVQVLAVATGKAETVFHETDPARVPEVAGWTPDARWVLYWRGPVGEDGPIDAAPASGGDWVNVFDPVLPYRDFLSACGSSIALVAGSGLDVSTGKQILLSGPPDWNFHDLTNDFSRSWIWPACSPNGRWLAASDTFSQSETANDTIPRALWLLATDGSSRRLLISGGKGAIEFPRWSSDGTVILVVRRSGNRWASNGSLLLAQIDPGSGKLVKLVGPIADLGSAPGPGGHQLWSEISDWYRP